MKSPTKNKKRKYIVYKITNTVNYKIYIGRTTQELEVRWSSHRGGINAKKNKYLKLYRAFKKYGIEKFIIEQIDEANNFKNLKTLEGQYILKYKSYLDEIGYNMSIDTERGLELLSEESKKRRSSSMHKAQMSKLKGKHGSGIRKLGPYFYADITNESKSYFLKCSCIEEAKLKYDKLAMYFYKENAVLHFPQNKYTQQELEDNFLEFKTKQEKVANKTFLSNYFGVTTDSKNRNFFRAIITANKKTYFLGYFPNETDAAWTVDKARYFLTKGKPSKRYNFAEKLPLLRGENLQKWFEEITIKRDHGVSYIKSKKHYEIKIPTENKSHQFYLTCVQDPTEAAEIRDMAILFFKKEGQVLNFPEKIMEYKEKYIETIQKLLDYKNRVRGISFCKTKNRYLVHFTINKKPKLVGAAKTKPEAEKIYNNFVIQNNLNLKLAN